MSQYTIASVSCGKDSLVIPHEYIKRGLRLDEVMMYDTGMEFQAIYDEWAALVKILDENGIKHKVLKPAYDFCWQMFERPVNRGKKMNTWVTVGAAERAAGGRLTKERFWGSTQKNGARSCWLELQQTKRTEEKRSSNHTNASR